MLTLDKEPSLITPNFLSNCLEWHLQDHDFVTDEGAIAVVIFALAGTYVPPFTDGSTFVILGETVVVDNSLATGEYVGLCVSGMGTQTEFTQTVSDAIGNHFIDRLTTSASGTTFVVTWNEVGVQDEYINDNDNVVYNAGVGNGTDPTYTNSRIYVELWEEGFNQPIATQEQDVRILYDSEPEVNIFNFSKDIKLRLNSYPPNFDDLAILTIGQKVFYIRYALLTPNGNGKYISKGFNNSGSVLVINAVHQPDDNRGTNRFTNFVIEPLNQYPKDCVRDSYAWMYYSLNLNHFFGSIGLEFDYKMEVQIIDSSTTYDIALGSEDGILQFPYGDLNLGTAIPDFSTVSFQIQADVIHDGVLQGEFTVSIPFSYKKGNVCFDREVYWLEQTGAYSTLGFSYDESINIQTEGETTCIAKPCGLGYTDKLKIGHSQSYGKKSKQLRKFKLEAKHTMNMQDNLLMFLASDEYYVKDLDKEGNEIMRRILLNYANTGLYKKGEVLELILSYEYSDNIKTQSNV